MPTLTRVRAAIVAALAAVVAVVTITVVVSDGDHDGRPDAVTVRLGPVAQARPDVPDTLTIPTPALDAAKASGADDHAGSRDEAPDGVAPEELRAGQRQQDDLAQRDDLPVVTPAAAPTQRGCRSRFVRNVSSRRGVRPRLWVIHYTVSANRPGWGDVDAITGLFNTPSFAASSNYVVDADGNCNYIVRESDKAWTQATFNPVSISVEIIATGREGRLAGPAGYRRLGQVISDSAKRWDIPLRQGAVKGCTVTRSGIVTHQMLGACGGGHSDISPYGLAAVIDAAKAARKPAPVGTAADRALCRKLVWYRRHRPTGTTARRRAIARRKALEGRKLRCTRAGTLARI